MKRNLLVLVISIISSLLQAQDPVFTNADQSLVSLNPSFAGSNGLFRNQAIYRNQWPNLSGCYVTISNSADIYFDKIKSGFALVYSHDDQAYGALKNDVFALAYSRRFSINEKMKITPSLQVGYFNKTLDWTKVTLGNQVTSGPFVPQFSGNPNTTSKQNINFSSGLLVEYNHFYFGASVFNINQPDEGLMGVSKLPFRLSVHASYNLLISGKTLVHFFARYQKQQCFQYYQFSASCVLVRSLILGAGYRSGNCPFVLVGYRHPLCTVQLNYESYYGAFAGAAASSYELSASFNLRPKEIRNSLVDFEKW